MSPKQISNSIKFPCNVYDLHGDYVGNIVFKYLETQETLIGTQIAALRKGISPTAFVESFRAYLKQGGGIHISHSILEDNPECFITLIDINFIDKRGNIHLKIGAYELVL